VVITLKHFATKLPVAVALTAIGTLFSGVIFLSVAIFVLGVELPIPFSGLVIGVVLPTVALNAIAFFFIFPIVAQLVKRSKFDTALSN